MTQWIKPVYSSLPEQLVVVLVSIITGLAAKMGITTINYNVDKDDTDHVKKDDKDIAKDDATAAYIDHGEVLAVLGVHLGVAGL